MQCADCVQDLDDALILVCDHNLCLSCAAKKAGGSVSIRCRVCASVTNLEPTSAQQLKEMFPQFSVRARPPLSAPLSTVPTPTLSTRSLPIPSDACGQCEQSRADLRCLQCEEILCFDCSETLHRRGKLAAHQIVPFSYVQHFPIHTGNCTDPSILGGNSPNMTSRSLCQDRSVITMRSVGCTQHPDEPVQYFCLRCETRPMCAECVFRSGEHSNHLPEVVLVKKAFPKIRSRMNDLVIAFEKSIKELKVGELNLFENKKAVETVGSSSRIQIEKYFNELRQMLKDKEGSLLGQVSDTVQREVAEIEKEINFCASRRDKIESVSRLLNSVRELEGSDSMSITEREIEILESFSEMKMLISDSRSDSEKNHFKLVQLYIPSDCVAIMDKQVCEIKSEIASLCGILPTRNIPISTPEITSALTTAPSSQSSRKKKHASSSRRPSATAGDMFLINAIDDAIRSG